MRRFYLAHFEENRGVPFECHEVRVVVAQDLFDAKRQFLDWYMAQEERTDKKSLNLWFCEEKGLE